MAYNIVLDDIGIEAEFGVKGGLSSVKGRAIGGWKIQ